METKLGFMLFYEVPAVYKVIMQLTRSSYYPEPKVALIEIICSVSDDSSLKKPKFQRYLQEYKEKGLYCGRAMKINPKQESYYAAIRAKKTAKYISKNAEIVDMSLLRLKLF